MEIGKIGIPICKNSSDRVTNKKLNYYISAQLSNSADIFCFKGSYKLSKDSVSIIPTVNPTELEKSICKNTGINPEQTIIKNFKNGEIYVNIQGDIRGKDVYIMPPHNNSVNDNLMETYIKADAAKRSGAGRVIALMPSFDYARQEKRVEKGEPITARLNMDLLMASGVDEIITSDLHTPAIEGFASNKMKITHLESMGCIKQYIESKQIPDLIVVSPDLGGTKRADKFAKLLGVNKAVVYKSRQAHNEATAENLIGDVKGKNCIIVDDIIDTAGTIVAASELLKKKGAKDIYICASHGLFNGDAIKKLQNSSIKEVIVTNSIPSKNNSCDKIKQVDISLQIAQAMQTISSKLPNKLS